MDTYQNPGSQIFTDSPQLAYGSFWERLGASIIDGLILLVPTFFIGLATGHSMFTSYRGGLFTYYASVDNWISIAVNWLYYALMESGPMQATLGKRALGLKVVSDKDGGRISFGQATGRYFGKIISMLILCIGYLMVLWDEKKQALHDKMASTLVVKA